MSNAPVLAQNAPVRTFATGTTRSDRVCVAMLCAALVAVTLPGRAPAGEITVVRSGASANAFPDGNHGLQAEALALEIRDAVAAELGVDPDELEVLDWWQEYLRGLGRYAEFAKIEDLAGQQALTVCRDQNVLFLDSTEVRQRDAEAKQRRTTKIHPVLAKQLTSIDEDGSVRVIIWCRMAEGDLPDPAGDTGFEPEDPLGIHILTPQERDAQRASAEAARSVRRAKIHQAVARATTPCAGFLQDIGVQPDHVSPVTPTIVATLSKTEIQDVAKRDDVVRIVGDQEQKRHMTVMLPAVAAPSVWPDYDGTGASIAIVEGDAIAANPHLGTFTSRPGSYSADPHKTKVAGCARSQHIDHRGAAPAASLFDAAASSMFWSDLKQAADWSVGQSVDVINNSWGLDEGGEWQDDDVYFDWLAFHNRITVVVAAGNDADGYGTGTGYVGSPGCAYNVLTVANADPRGGGNFRIHPSSSWRDPESDGDKPEIAAPGEADGDAFFDWWDGLLINSPWYGGAGTGGTSFAAPIVAGICGLVIDRAPALADWPEVLKAKIMVGGLHRNIEGSSRLSEYDGAGMATARCVYAGSYRLTVTEGSFNASDEFELDTDISLEAGVTKRIVMVYGHRPQVQDPWFPDPVGDYDRCDLDLRLYVNGTRVASSVYSERNAFEIIDYTPSQTGIGRIRLRKYSWDSGISNLRVAVAYASSTLLEPPCDAPARASSPSPSDGAAGVSTNADLDWANASAADSYEVYFGTDSTPDSGEYQGSTSTSGWALGTLAEDTTYYWRIDTVNDCGTTTGQVWSFTTSCTSPAQASSPSPANGSPSVPTDADLNWANAPGADSYDVYFGTDSTPDSGEYQSNTGSSNWALGTLAEGTTYYWRIDTVNACGTTEGFIWSFTTCNRPGTPSGPSPPDGASGVSACADLDWNNASGADSYEVYFGTDATPDDTEYLGNPGSSSWALPELTWGTTYYWQIDAVNNCGTTRGPVWAFSTEPEPLTVTSPNGGEVWSADEIHTVTWTSARTDGDVLVELYQGGAYKRYIAYVPVTHGHVDWVPLPWEGDGADYRIRIRWIQDWCVYDESNGSFSVFGSSPPPVITVLEPNGGEQWEAGSQQGIRWSATNPQGDVWVTVRRPELSSWYLYRYPMSAEFAPWTVSPIFGDSGENVAEIRSTVDPSIIDSSDNPFTTFGSLPVPEIVVTSPNGGETLGAGTTHPITWDATNPYGTVWVGFCHVGSCTWIGSAEMESRRFDWQIPPWIGDGSDYTVYVQSSERPDIRDSSDSSFSVSGSVARPTISITSPNGGETLSAGAEYTITWSAVNPVEDLCFELRRAGNWVAGLGCTPMAATTFDWAVPLYGLDATDYVIRAFSPVDYAVRDDSDAPFTITGSLPLPTLTLTSPNGGESWKAGTTQLITWESTSPEGTVDVELLKNGERWEWIGSAPTADGQLPWELCTYLGNGSDYVVRITWRDKNAYVQDYSDAPFEITGSLPRPTLTLTSPNGGETWQAGTTQTVTWDSTDASGNVDAWLLKSGEWWEWIGSAPMVGGQLSWDICPYIGDGTDYTIRIEWCDCGGCVTDESDAPFEIAGSVPLPTLTLTGPNGGETWEAGTTQTITWDSTNPTGDVRIRLYKDGNYYQHLGFAPMADGSFVWQICPYTGDGADYTIRLSWSEGCGYVEDYSDAPFEITGSAPAPTITVTNPSGGEVWTAGTTKTVEWTSDTSEGYVDVYAVSGAGDEFWIDQVLVTDGSVSWDICPSIGDGTDYTIHLNWWPPCGPPIEDISVSDPFEIAGSLPRPTLTLTSPNGGEAWGAGTTQTVTWGSTDPAGEVNAWLIAPDAQGRTWWWIGSAPMTDGQLSWDICPYFGDGADYTIRIEACDCGPCVTDESDAPFEITGSAPAPTITVTNPTVGDVWTAGTTQTISWTSDTSEGYVEIALYKGDEWWQWIDYVPISDGSVSWDICPSIGAGTDYTIHLNWWPECGPSVEVISDPFEIAGSLPRPTLTLTSPNGGETWEAGTTQLITWNSTDASGDVSVYLVKAGDWWDYIGSAPMADGQLSWDICPYVGDGADYTIRIEWCDCGGCVTDESDAPFEIAASLSRPTLTLTSPNGGETWAAGTAETITWDSTNASGDVSVYLLRAGDWWDHIGSAPMADGQLSLDICPYVGDGADYTIWIEACDCGPCVTDESDAAFEIAGSVPLPTLTLTGPNGGETWEAGTTQTITWDSTNPTGDVRIRLYKDGNYYQHLGFAPMADGSFVWQICPYTGDGADYTIRLSWSEGCGYVEDYSDAPFEITGSAPAPEITVTTPTPGAVWEECTPATIEWETTATSGSVDIYVWNESCSCGIYIGTAPVVDRLFEWDLVYAFLGPGTDYYIGLYLNKDGCASIEAQSENFEIAVNSAQPQITITSPAADTVWQAGTTEMISWSSDATEGYVDVYAVSGAGDWFWIDYVPVSTGSVSWDICPSIGDGTDYVIHLFWWPGCGSAVETESDAFEITGTVPSPTLTLTSPNGGEAWEAGTTELVTWDSTDPSGDVSVYLMRAGDWWDYIGSAPMVDGQLRWDICPYIGDRTDYTVRIEWCDCGPCVTDDSDAPFEISGAPTAPLTITSPVGGEVWQVGTTQTISWSSDTCRGYVEVIWTRGAGDWHWIDIVPVSDGSVSWDICPSIGDGADYTIRLNWWPECGQPVEVASNAFEITGSLPPPTLMLTSPNGGEVWTAGTTQFVTWDSTSASCDVAVYFKRPGGWWEPIGSAPMADGQLSWDICPYVGGGTNYTIRIECCDCGGCVSDESDAPFEIITGDLPTISVISPAGGEVWMAGSTQPISWTSDASEGYVDIRVESGDGQSNWIDSVPITDGTLNWDICPTIGDSADYTIELTWWPECEPWWWEWTTIVGATSEQFEIAGSAPTPTLELTSPNGGEDWQIGSEQTIMWDSTNPTGYVDAYLLKSGDWWDYIGSAPMADGQLSWDICSYFEDEMDYTIWIESCDCGPCINDESDGPFAITSPVPPRTLTVTSPSGGEPLEAGTTLPISWDSTNPGGEAQVRLLKCGQEWDYIGSAAMADGQLSWDICRYTGDGTDFTIQVSACDCSGCAVDESEPFEITGSLPWPVIASSVPPNGKIDPRQPSTIDGTDSFGWSSVEVHYADIVCDMHATDFATHQESPGQPAEPGPEVTAVSRIDDYTIRVQLDRPIEPGLWTEITHQASGTSICLGYLPSDVNQDGESTSADIASLIDCLNRGANPCEPWRCDMDRLGTCTGADISRIVDLLNSADGFDSWIGRTLGPSPCGP